MRPVFMKQAPWESTRHQFRASLCPPKSLDKNITEEKKYKQYQELAKTLRFFDPFCNYYQWQHSKTALWLLLFLLQNSPFFLSIGCKTISGSAINLPGLVYLLCSKIMFFQNRALVSVRTNWIMVNCLRDKWQHTKGLRSVTRVYHLVTYNRL